MERSPKDKLRSVRLYENGPESPARCLRPIGRGGVLYFLLDGR
jgi:hypothetical protein